jgi:hypothetical protein
VFRFQQIILFIQDSALLASISTWFVRTEFCWPATHPFLPGQGNAGQQIILFLKKSADI